MGLFGSLFSKNSSSAAVASQLTQARQSINEAFNEHDALIGIVKYFNATATLDDNLGIITTELREQNKNDEFQNALKAFSAHVRNSGRDSSGYNRTKNGETVTTDNVFLGGDTGYAPTKTVSHWLSVRQSNNPTDKELISAIEAKAKWFIDTHRPILGYIDTLLRTVQK